MFLEDIQADTQTLLYKSGFRIPIEDKIFYYEKLRLRFASSNQAILVVTRRVLSHSSALELTLNSLFQL